jgi:hypothetical protein
MATTIHTMKTLIALSSAAAVAALSLSSLSVEATASVLFTLGFSAIALADYSRTARPLTAVIAVTADAGRRVEKLGLAA